MNPKQKENGRKKLRCNNLQKIQIFTFLRITFFLSIKTLLTILQKKVDILMKKMKVYSNIFNQ